MASAPTNTSNCNSSEFEVVRELIAAQLRKEGIQLWLGPYTVEESGEVGQFPSVSTDFQALKLLIVDFTNGII